MELILASRSPRRRELLALTGLHFRVVTPHTDEHRQPGEAPHEYARRLSREKAGAAASLFSAPALILAADTVVIDGQDVLGKPRDAAEARTMLGRLRGRAHQVCTGVTLLRTSPTRQAEELACSTVTMRRYTAAELEAYLATGDPFDKAGAYAIQHPGFRPVTGFDHCFANVMGLPLCHVVRLLRLLGIEPGADVPAACQRALAYDCPVHQRILAGEE